MGETLAGLIDYRLEGGIVVLLHTEVDPVLQGGGLGTRLVKEALADIRARGLRLVPLCSFVADYVRRHPEEADLVAGDGAGGV